MTGASSETADQLLKLVAAADSMDTLVESKILANIPDWSRFEKGGLLPNGASKSLGQLANIDPSTVKIVVSSYPEILTLLPQVLSNLASESTPALYLLTVFGEACRVDSTMWDVLAKISSTTDMFTPFTLLLGRPNIDTYLADKCIQVLTSVMAHAREGTFTIQQVKLVCSGLISGQYRASQVGVLDGLLNLLKHDSYRISVFEVFGTMEKILAVSVETPAALYKALFCVWVSSFNDEVLRKILAKRSETLVTLLTSTFTDCRVEKILRMGLSVVKNLMASPTIAEALVESGILHAIQPLEYEKWRDSELYDEIRSAAARIAHETSKHSNFDRYEKELASGQLRRGFIHSEKFWLENYQNFERENFAPVQRLINLLGSSDSTTQAVACHDLGEFARLHPSGKRIIAKLNGKNVVMSLMTSANREVAKEALLCTQKLMLNQWDKVAATSAAPQVRVK